MAGEATWTGSPSIKGSTEARRMALLTLCLAGVQFTWGIEMAYCTPYLLSLGISKSKTSLIWIAGPLSGLITQPIVGVLADRSRLKWGRRRPFMIMGSIIVALGLLLLGWTSELVGLFIDEESEKGKTIIVVVAVFSIYALDFAVNAVQASCRAIIVDTLPIPRQQHGSAWASRMIAVGHVLSYLAGTLDLVGWFGSWFLGNTQFKKLCIISGVALLACVGITSWAVTERVLISRRETDEKGIFQIFSVIWTTLWHLPTRIRAICMIQFFAWLGWFPFLFYSSTFVGEVFQRYDKSTPEPDNPDRPKDAVGDIARVGSLALVIFACVSLIGSITLPWVVIPPPSDSEHRKQPPKNRIASEIFRRIKPLRPDLEMAWLLSHLLFACAMIYAVFVASLKAATVLVALCGIPWAITCWAPFSMVGEEINRISHGSDRGRSLLSNSGEVYDRLQQIAEEDEFDIGSDHEDEDDVEMGALGGLHAPTPSTPGSRRGSGQASPTLHIVATPNNEDEEEEEPVSSTGELAGVYLGILNLFITLPQFVGSFVSFVVFAILEPGKSPELAGEGETPLDGPKTSVNAIAVTMTLGGFGSLVAAWRTYKLRKLR